MLPDRQGSFRLFRYAGIDVFLHWSWFLVAVFEVSYRSRYYTSALWNTLEYLSLFLIVMLHEFGHALACRQVGGRADQIVLWPLGGVAYVAPPQRPGATLWSIAAGPLVNVALLPILGGLWLLANQGAWAQTMPNAHAFVTALCYINVLLLVFNLLPIYPLDGGQILRSLLWYALGRGRSLLVASMIGLAGSAALVGLAAWMRSIWIGIMAAFILMNSWRAWQMARSLVREEQILRRDGMSCPACGASPPKGDFWLCSNCQTRFDTFQTLGTCPRCGDSFPITTCPACGATHRMTEWQTRR